MNQIPKAYLANYKKAMRGKSRKSAVKAFCLECVGWAKEEVRLCTSRDCPLFPYRPYKLGASEAYSGHRIDERRVADPQHTHTEREVREMARHKKRNQQLLDLQNGSCALCKQPIPAGPNQMCYYEPRNVVVCRTCSRILPTHTYKKEIRP